MDDSQVRGRDVGVESGAVALVLEILRRAETFKIPWRRLLLEEIRSEV